MRVGVWVDVGVEVSLTAHVQAEEILNGVGSGGGGGAMPINLQ